MEIGKKIFIETTGNAARNVGSRIIETKITKVGRKYFEVEELNGVRFFIDTMEQDTNYSRSYIAYNTRQEIEDKNELNELKDKLRKCFDIWGNTNLTLDQYRRISNIVDEAN